MNLPEKVEDTPPRCLIGVGHRIPSGTSETGT